MDELSVNKLEVSGRLVDAILRETTSGRNVLNANLIVVDRVKDQKEFNQRIHLVAWNDLAKRMSKMPLEAKVRIQGKLETSSWIDKSSGVRKYRLQIVVGECESVAHLQAPPSASEIQRRPIDSSDIPF